MRKVLMTGAALLALLSAGTGETAELSGYCKSWLADTKKGPTVITIHQDGGKITGEAYRLNEGEDKKIDKNFIKDLLYMDGRIEGKIYLPRFKEYASMTLVLVSEEKLQVDVSLYGRTVTKYWKRYR